MKNISSVRILDVFKTIEIKGNQVSLISYFNDENGDIGLMLILTAGRKGRTVVLEYSETCTSGIEDGDLFLDVTYKDVYAWCAVDKNWKITLKAETTKVA